MSALNFMTPAMSNIFAPEVAGQVATQAIPEVAGQALVNPALAQVPNTLSGIGEANMIQPAMGNVADSGMFGSWGNFGNAMTGDQGQNVLKGVGQGYNMYQTNRAYNDANNIQQEQLAMSKDAYGRDKTNAERTQKLNF